eukprot:TRINITY_DN13489_c0_g1_i1.p1 TRINITY_DN13489_c0_g1~~TRINITY_DN13489_c0_g1_i1.p1  ORF type:complete len:315 (-),score=40.09 TRINITY_DN13489_c0_g1_i1:41-985(-)
MAERPESAPAAGDEGSTLGRALRPWSSMPVLAGELPKTPSRCLFPTSSNDGTAAAELSLSPSSASSWTRRHRSLSHQSPRHAAVSTSASLRRQSITHALLEGQYDMASAKRSSTSSDDSGSESSASGVGDGVSDDEDERSCPPLAVPGKTVAVDSGNAAALLSGGATPSPQFSRTASGQERGSLSSLSRVSSRSSSKHDKDAGGGISGVGGSSGIALVVATVICGCGCQAPYEVLHSRDRGCGDLISLAEYLYGIVVSAPSALRGRQAAGGHWQIGWPFHIGLAAAAVGYSALMNLALQKPLPMPVLITMKNGN